MLETRPGPPDSPNPRLAKWLPIALIAAAAIAFFALGFHRYLSFETLRESRSALLDMVRLHPVVAPVSYIVLYAVVTACSLPGALVMTLTGGFLFGTLLGATYTVIGATAGATLLFLAARTAFGDMLRARAGGALKKLEAGFRENAFSYLLVLRLVPIFPFFIVNLAAAFLGAALPVFVVATFIGIIPGTTVFASVGSGLGTVFDSGGKPDLGLIFTWPILGPLIGLALLSLLPVAYKRWKHDA